MKKRKTKSRRKPNPYARSLLSSQYRARTIPDKRLKLKAKAEAEAKISADRPTHHMFTNAAVAQLSADTHHERGPCLK